VLQRVTDQFLELKDAESKSIRIPISEIEEQRQSTVSLMPQDIFATMTPSEFVDLIAYMQILQTTKVRRIDAAGFIDDAPMVRKPVLLKPHLAGNTFDHPVAILSIPNQPNHFVVVEQSGKCWKVNPNGKNPKELILDISNRVRVGGATGLLGFAFHPRFQEDPRVFLKFQIHEAGRIVTIVEECQWTTSNAETRLSNNRLLLRITGSTQDHNGGSIAFGPDNMLYIGMGDSGPQRDPEGHGQDLSTLLGKILRIDIDHQSGELPYAIPKDNPFVDHSSARKEIWAYGFREPWRISFDFETKDLWVGDVGQDRYEEVSIVRKGENLGWNVFEGFAEFSNQYRTQSASFTQPIMSYPRSLGVSVTGGHVYRGKLAPQFYGWYVFGDFESRRIWAVKQEDRVLVDVVELGRAPSRIVSFAEQPTGELLLVGFDDGVIRQLDLLNVDTTPLRRRVMVDTAELSPVLWRYTCTMPGGDWTQSNYEDREWKVGPAGFGTVGTPGSMVRTDWNTSDIWLRREFNLKHPIAESTKVFLRLHHDEDVEVYLNGVLAVRADRWTSGYVEVPVPAAAKATIHEGTNSLAVHCHQNSGGQFIDLGIIEVLDE
jgi:glucose/arabinose dehydrogenase